MYLCKANQTTPCQSLWQALNLPEKPTGQPLRIAAVGSGGKTSLLYVLAREGRTRGFSVLLLPTTHMFRPDRDGVFTAKAEEVIRKLESDGFAIAGIPVASEKIAFPGWDVYHRAGAAADLVLIEADGSKRLPLKYPNETEPVLPEDVNTILTITGMNALGQPPEAVCHRIELARKMLRNDALLQISPEHTDSARLTQAASSPDWLRVKLSDMMYLQQTGYLRPLRQSFPNTSVIPIWNQADTPALQEAARRTLLESGETDGLITSFISQTHP